MKRFGFFLFALCLLFLIQPASAAEYSWRQLDIMDERLTRIHEGLEQHKTDPSDLPPNQGWILRSKHFIFGMPRLNDRRHDFNPDGEVIRAGITVLVREGFVIAHFDRMRAPLFVCQRWTKADYHRMKKIDKQFPGSDLDISTSTKTPLTSC